MRLLASGPVQVVIVQTGEYIGLYPGETGLNVAWAAGALIENGFSHNCAGPFKLFVLGSTVSANLHGGLKTLVLVDCWAVAMCMR